MIGYLSKCLKGLYSTLLDYVLSYHVKGIFTKRNLFHNPEYKTRQHKEKMSA